MEQADDIGLAFPDAGTQGSLLDRGEVRAVNRNDDDAGWLQSTGNKHAAILGLAPWKVHSTLTCSASADTCQPSKYFNVLIVP